MLAEQAIFTSVRGARLSGYQVAATSPGVTPEQARELARWGPAHDSLLEGEAANSLNFHRLQSGHFCVSRTVVAGAEYSGRGHRIYTQFLILAPPEFLSVDNHPLRLWELARTCGAVEVLEEVPTELPPVQLLDGIDATDWLRTTTLIQQLGTDKLAALVDAATWASCLGVVSPLRGEELLFGLFSVLPTPHRSELSFTTGLKHSPRRPFRILLLPQDRLLQRRAARSAGCEVLDLTRSDWQPAASGWGRFVAELFHSGRQSLLSDILEQARLRADVDLEQLADEMLAKL